MAKKHISGQVKRGRGRGRYQPKIRWQQRDRARDRINMVQRGITQTEM